MAPPAHGAGIGPEPIQFPTRVPKSPLRAELPVRPGLDPQLLQAFDLFEPLSDGQREDVARRMEMRSFDARETIVREGTTGDAVYFLLRGGVEVWRRDAASGVDFPLPVMGAGQSFGELSFLSGRPRRGTVIAAVSTVCGVLTSEALVDLLDRHPAVALSLARVLARRIEAAGPTLGVELVNLSKMQIPVGTVRLLPQHLILDRKILPIAFGKNRLTLGMTNPHDILALDDVRRLLGGVVIKPVLVIEEDFRRFVASMWP